MVQRYRPVGNRVGAAVGTRVGTEVVGRERPDDGRLELISILPTGELYSVALRWTHAFNGDLVAHAKGRAVGPTMAKVDAKHWPCPAAPFGVHTLAREHFPEHPE